MNGHPPSTGWSPTSQNIPEGSVLQTWNFAPEGSLLQTLNLAPRHNSQNEDWVPTAMDDQLPSYHHQDGTPPSKGWPFTIQNLPEENVLQT